MEKAKRKNRISLFFWMFVLVALLIFIVFLYRALSKPKYFISPEITKKKIALRGKIKSDKFILAKSKQVYGVYILPRYIDSTKKEMFIKLFSIYSGISSKELRERLKSNPNKNVLLGIVDLKTKQDLIYLRHILDKFRVFRIDEKSGYRIGYYIENLDFVREYPYGDTFEPYLGRYRSDIKRGENGIEYYYDKRLKEKKDGFIRGNRDVFGNIVFNKNTKISPAINGEDIKLNINLILQRRIEKLLDKKAKEYNVSNIVAAVMDSESGKIVAIASSNRYDPNKITPKDIKNMKISAVKDLFEPGSVMKPFLMAILLENKKVKLNEVINGLNGYWKPKWRKKAIRDDIPFKKLTLDDIITYSSNIGIAKLAFRLSGKEIRDGLLKFGFGKKSGIDLPFEEVKPIRSATELRYPGNKISIGFGYGISVTFVQLLKAFDVFNNNGFLVTPRIAFKSNQKIKIISPKTSEIILNMLRDVVLKGTGKSAYVDGIFTAGKTGTAHIFSLKEKKYINVYNSSFFGFANDKKHKYTIGVVFYKINMPNPYYFASHSAAPTFKEIVDIMLEENLLKRDNSER